MKKEVCEIVIIGGGMVGLSIAHQLIERQLTKNIIVIEKENKTILCASKIDCACLKNNGLRKDNKTIDK